METHPAGLHVNVTRSDLGHANVAFNESDQGVHSDMKPFRCCQINRKERMSEKGLADAHTHTRVTIRNKECCNMTFIRSDPLMIFVNKV